MSILHCIDFYARRVIAYPLAILGFLGTLVSRECLYAAAWIVDMDLKDVIVDDEDHDLFI